MNADNANAFYDLAGYYANNGEMGMPQDMVKANESCGSRAGELGCLGELACSHAYCNLGISYNNGIGVGVDKKKAKHFWEIAAMNGNVRSRHNLGCMEVDAGQ